MHARIHMEQAVSLGFESMQAFLKPASCMQSRGNCSNVRLQRP